MRKAYKCSEFEWNFVIAIALQQNNNKMGASAPISFFTVCAKQCSALNHSKEFTFHMEHFIAWRCQSSLTHVRAKCLKYFQCVTYLPVCTFFSRFCVCLTSAYLPIFRLHIFTVHVCAFVWLGQSHSKLLENYMQQAEKKHDITIKLGFNFCTHIHNLQFARTHTYK